jgi:hypothetical protein
VPAAPSSLIALRLATPLDAGAVVAAARAAGGVDRDAPRGDGRVREVHWGGRLQRGAVRALDADGVPLLRTEVEVAADGVVAGLARQAALVAALAAAAPDGTVLGVRDLSALADRDGAWLARVADGGATVPDAVTVVVEPGSAGTLGWARTHGAARFGVPDLELYGLAPGTGAAAADTLVAVAAALLAGGLGAPLALPDGTRLRLVPVLEAWPRLPRGWAGVGRPGALRGPGLDGPRATLSVLHRARLGRHRLDLAGVTGRLTPR